MNELVCSFCGGKMHSLNGKYQCSHCGRSLNKWKLADPPPAWEDIVRIDIIPSEGGLQEWQTREIEMPFALNKDQTPLALSNCIRFYSALSNFSLDFSFTFDTSLNEKNDRIVVHIKATCFGLNEKWLLDLNPQEIRKYSRRIEDTFLEEVVPEDGTAQRISCEVYYLPLSYRSVQGEQIASRDLYGIPMLLMQDSKDLCRRIYEHEQPFPAKIQQEMENLIKKSLHLRACTVNATIITPF